MFSIMFVVYLIILIFCIVYSFRNPSYRIIKKCGHGGYWIERKVLFFWMRSGFDSEGRHRYFANYEWAENKVREFMTKSKIEVIQEFK